MPRTRPTISATATDIAPLLEIAKTRENAWVNVKNKSHVLKKVYTSNEDFSSVLVLGTAKFEFT